MGKTLRIILIVIGVLIVLLIVAPFLVPVNQFRPAIEQKASDALGRKVQVGNLSLSLWSGALGADNLSIADDPKFSNGPFLTAKSVRVGVEMMPLIFSRALHVTGVTIENPEVTLLKNPAGRWNYSSLGESPAPGAKPGAPQAPAGAAPAQPGGAAGGAPEVSIQKLELKDGRMVVGTTSSQKRHTYDHVTVTASGVSLTSKVPVTVTADLPDGGKFNLEGNVGPVDQTDTAMTPVDATIKVNGMNLASTGFLDPSLGLGGILDLDAKLNSQGGKASTNGTAKLSKALLIQGGSPASVPATVDFSTTYDMRKEAGVLNPSTLKIGSAAAKLSGTYQTPADTTIVNVKLDAANMPAKDLQSFLPAIAINLPKGASLQSGTLSANLDISGPTNKLVTNGTVGLYEAKLAGFDLGSKMSAISALTGLKTGNDLNIQKLTTNLHMAPDGLRADNLLAILPSLGNLAGGGTIDSRNNLDFKMAATLVTSTVAGAAASPVSATGGLLGKLTGGGGGGCKGTTIPFLIKGTTADPKFLPDVGGLAAGFLKSQLGCAGSAVPGATKQANPAANPADLVQGLGGLFKKKKP